MPLLAPPIRGPPTFSAELESPASAMSCACSRTGTVLNGGARRATGSMGRLSTENRIGDSGHAYLRFLASGARRVDCDVEIGCRARDQREEPRPEELLPGPQSGLGAVEVLGGGDQGR